MYILLLSILQYYSGLTIVLNMNNKHHPLPIVYTMIKYTPSLHKV